MRLSNIAILAIRGHKDIKKMLSEALDVTPKVIYEYIRRNDDNLTKAAALEIIKRELKIPEDQILERDKAAKDN